MKTGQNKILRVLMDALSAIQFPATYDDAPCLFTGPVFESVRAFDFDDIALAFEELLVFKNRVAFVVMTDEAQSSAIEGRVMTTVFHDDFSILCSDRSYKNRQLALLGDATTPGVNMIADILVKSIMGEIAPGFVCEPKGGEMFALTGETRDNEIGRIGWRQHVIMHGGREARDLSRQALLTLAPKRA